MNWSIYLAGEIHSDWRTRLIQMINERNLPILCTGPVIDHNASDNCGTAILGEEEQPFWKDRKGAGINAIRTRSLMEQADVVVVAFGDKYRQWNAAFDAGYAAALGKPLVIIHPEEFDHALKEVDQAANAVARKPEQVVDILQYILTGELPAGDN
ncbi:YtoQ family protein [Balneolales bacterium ANBcel1]|nr:YtoQ family protein [Balneolales bacterium ANBcel1]